MINPTDFIARTGLTWVDNGDGKIGPEDKFFEKSGEQLKEVPFEQAAARYVMHSAGGSAPVAPTQDPAPEPKVRSELDVGYQFADGTLMCRGGITTKFTLQGHSRDELISELRREPAHSELLHQAVYDVARAQDVPPCIMIERIGGTVGGQRIKESYQGIIFDRRRSAEGKFFYAQRGNATNHVP